MNDSKTESPAPDPAPEPDSTSPARPPAQEGWLERLKAAVGLRAAVPIRQEIAEALDTEDAVAGFSPEERAMLANILRLREVRVDDVMVPRADIDAVEVGTSLADLLAEFQRSGHSRMPVYRETLDDPIGFVHIKGHHGFRCAHRGGRPGRQAERAGNGANGSGNGVGRPATAFDCRGSICRHR